MSQRGREIRELPVDLRRLAESQSGVLTGGQLSATLTDRRVRLLLEDGQLREMWWNSYCLPGRERDIVTQLKAAEFTLGRPPTACLDTAAALFGFDVARDLRLGPGRVHVMAPAKHHSECPPLSLHRFRLLTEPVEVAGHRATDPAETAVRLAGSCPDAMRALGVLDAALKAGCTTTVDMAQIAAQARFRGIAKVRDVLPLADDRPESPPESWTRYVCIKFGLPKPVPQLWVTGSDGRRYRLDLGWERFKVGLEYDGEDFHTGDGSMGKDRRKWNAVSRAGWALYSLTNESFWSSGRDLVLGMVAEEIAHRALNGVDVPALVRRPA